MDIATSIKQRANRMTFGHRYGSGRSTSDSQLKREHQRLTKHHAKKKKA